MTIGISRTTSQGFFRIKNGSRKGSVLDKPTHSRKINESMTKIEDSDKPKVTSLGGAMLKYINDLNPALASRKIAGLDASPKALNNTLKSLKSDINTAKLPKDKLKKKDIANESFEVEMDKDSMTKKFIQERFVLGMQHKPITFSHLGRTKNELSSAQANEWNLDKAGCGVELSENKTKECIQEVSAYRHNYFASMQEKKELIEKEMVSKAYKLRLAAQKGEIQQPSNRNRSKKRRTVLTCNSEPKHWHSKYDQI